MKSQASTAAVLPLGEDPLVSVVIPVRNEERFILDTLQQLLTQDYPHDRSELLVCDGQSEDRTRELVREVAQRDSRVRLIDNPGRRSSSGRNVGFRAARGEIVLVVDGHVQIPDRQLLRHVVECFRSSGADCLGRPQPLIEEPGQPWSEAISQARSSRLGHNPGSMIFSDYEGFAPAASMGAAYRPHVFQRVGLVDESFDACEDLEFNTRVDKAGLRCFTSPKLTVRYFARCSPWQLFRQLYRYGFGRFQYLTQHSDRLSVGQLLPPLLVSGLVAIPLLWLVARPLALAGTILTAVYAVLILAGAIRLSVLHGARHFGRYLMVLPIVHFAVGIGFLASMLRGGRLNSPPTRPEGAGE